MAMLVLLLLLVCGWEAAFYLFESPSRTLSAGLSSSFFFQTSRSR